MRNALARGFNHQTHIGKVGIPFLTLACAAALLACSGRALGNEGDNLWGHDGISVPNSDGSFQHTSDGVGGTIIAFARTYYTGYGPVYAVRIDAAGTILWGPELLSDSNADGTLPRICSDGSGGAFVAWKQPVTGGASPAYVQRINANGIPQWPSPITAGTSIGSLAVAAGNHGIFLIYDNATGLHAAYMNGSGALATPGIGGLSLGTGGSPLVVPDGSGGNGVIVAWFGNGYDNGLEAQRVVLSGGTTLSKAWPSPTTICNQEYQAITTVAQDGSGGALISWAETDFSQQSPSIQIRVQKINSSGIAQWTANGVVVMDSSVEGGSTPWSYPWSDMSVVTSAVANDGSGGAYVAWDDWRNDVITNNKDPGNDDIYAQHLNASGVPQWTSGGINLPYYEAGCQRYPSMVSDLQGGALVTFQDEGGWSWDISLVKLNSAGKAWVKWPVWDSHSQTDPGKDQFNPVVVYDGSGPVPKGCIVAWTEEHWQVAAQKVQIGGGSPDLASQGTAILGTESSSGADTPVFHQGVGANINDGSLSTRVDTWNSTNTDPLSYVGIVWSQPAAGTVARLELTLATFQDGGWFGPNNMSPGPGGPLSPTYLAEPEVQVTTDGGTTWNTVGHTSDYLTALNGHGIGGGAFPNPSSVTATFLLNTPATNIDGIRLIGSEGGIASGGFLGVFELAVFPFTDSDSDGMDDVWESNHGLNVGLNDAGADADGDGLDNLQEYRHSTDPQNPDTDGDGYIDGIEVQGGSNPTSAASIPNNLARRMDASGIMGTMNALGGTATPVYHMGTAANINDGDLTTRVDTWNGTGTDPLSYVGILWSNTQNASIGCLRLDLATFVDGGWFGPNGMCPGADRLLSAAYLTEPDVQVSTNGGVTWTTVNHTSDYFTSLNGHQISTSGGNPTLATAIFRLTKAVSGINGIRLVGSEGGVASGGFLGVFELEVLTKIPVRLFNPKVVKMQGLPPTPGLQFEFEPQAGLTYEIQVTRGFNPARWTTVVTTQSVERSTTPIIIAEPVSGRAPTFFRVVAR